MNKIKISKKDIAELNRHEKLLLICRKCNHEWTEIRPKGHHVRYDSKGNFLVKHNSTEKIYFKCPKCGERDIGRLRHIEKGQEFKVFVEEKEE